MFRFCLGVHWICVLCYAHIYSSIDRGVLLDCIRTEPWTHDVQVCMRCGCKITNVRTHDITLVFPGDVRIEVDGMTFDQIPNADKLREDMGRVSQRIYTYIYIYVCVYVCIHMYICIHVYVCACIHICIHIHVLMKRPLGCP